MWVPIQIIFEMGQRLLRYLPWLIGSGDVEAHQIRSAEIWFFPRTRLGPEEDVLGLYVLVHPPDVVDVEHSRDESLGQLETFAQVGD